jgi:uncharacterized protein
MSDVTIFNAPAPLDSDGIAARIAPLLTRHGAVKAFLIGSYARQSADAWSDVDLVVVMPSEKSFVDRPLELTDILEALPVAVDVLVYTPQEFDRGMRRGRGIFDVIAREGIAIL